jgi:hypothetical protein
VRTHLRGAIEERLDVQRLWSALILVLRAVAGHARQSHPGISTAFGIAASFDQKFGDFDSNRHPAFPGPLRYSVLNATRG